MIVHALHEISGATITLSNTHWGTTDNVIFDAYETIENPPADVDVFMHHSLPSEFVEHESAVNIGITAGTEVNRISPKWVIGCNRMDAIFVSSTFAKASFVNSSYSSQDGSVTIDVEPDVFVIGECVDQDIFCASDTSSSVIDDVVQDDFVFLNVSSWDDVRPGVGRKGVTELIEIASSIFADHDNVSLVLKTGSSNPVEQHENQRKVKQLKADSNLDIHLVQGILTPHEMAGLYNRADSYVTFTRGEAFGRGMLESLCCETPVIAPGVTGQTDFLSTNHALLIGADERRVPVQHMRHDHFPTGSSWFEPKRSDMQLAMLMMFNDNEHHVKKVKRWNQERGSEFDIVRFKESLESSILKVTKNKTTI